MIYLGECQDGPREDTSSKSYNIEVDSASEPVQAAFESLDEAMSGYYKLLNELVEDFEEHNHFAEPNARISLSIDVVEISEDEFNRINSKTPMTGKFVVLAVPLNKDN